MPSESTSKLKADASESDTLRECVELSQNLDKPVYIVSGQFRRRFKLKIPPNPLFINFLTVHTNLNVFSSKVVHIATFNSNLVYSHWTGLKVVTI